MNKGLGEFPGTFHEFFELVKAGQLHYGSLFEWYKDWWTKTDQENVLVVKYEDLVKDGVAEVRRIARFLEKNLDNRAVESIVDACKIDRMRVKPTTRLSGPDVPFNHEKGNFYRKGGIGDWKNHLTEEDSKWVDKQCEKYLQPLGLSFDYE